MSSAPEFPPKYPETMAEDTENEGASESRETTESQLAIDSIDPGLLAKRKATPFTSTMDVALATAFTTEKNILDGTFRAHGVPTRQQKLAAWERIRDCVNAFSGDSNLKTVQQCKDRHRNLIQAVRFKRSSGFLEGPLPLPTNNSVQEMVDQQVDSIREQHGRQDKPTDKRADQPQASAPEQANGIPSTSAPSLAPKEKRPPKRPSSSPMDSVEEYRKRKLAILVKEHIVRVELMKAQTEYYRTKTELMLKHSCSRPTSLPTSAPSKLPPHLHPNIPENT